MEPQAKDSEDSESLWEGTGDVEPFWELYQNEHTGLSDESDKELLELSSREGDDDEKKQLIAKHKYTFNNTTGEKRKASVGRIVCLEDDRIVVSSFMWPKLKVYDKDYNYCCQAEVSLKSVITHYSGNEIALAAQKKKFVKFYAIEKSRIVELPKTFQLEHETYHIEYGNNHFGLMLKSVDPTSGLETFYIGILDEDGVEKHALYSVKTDTYKLKISLFFCMDPTEDRVIVTDGYSHKIACMTYRREILFEVSIGKLSPSGVLMIERVIIVAASRSHVVEIKQVGDRYIPRILLRKKDHVVDPIVIALQPKSKCLLTGCYVGEHRDFVQAFQLTWSET